MNLKKIIASLLLIVCMVGVTVPVSAEVNNDVLAKKLETMTATMKEELANEDTRAELQEVIDSLTINEFTVVMYANALYQTVKTEFVADVSILDPTTSETLAINLSGFMDYFNIGEVKEITLPEVDPSEILDLNDMY